GPRRQPASLPGWGGNRPRQRSGARVRGDFAQAQGCARRLWSGRALAQRWDGAGGGGSTRVILVIDNYDSFTFNLVQYLWELGARVEVFRNDKIDIAGIRDRRPEALVLSPGPCTPTEAGVCVPAIRELSGAVPILGVCLGHQAIGQAFGGRVVRAKRVMHGKTSPIEHDGSGIFSGLKAPLEAGRYHSLVVERNSLPSVIR